MNLSADSAMYRRVRWGLSVGLVLVMSIPVAVRMVGGAEATARPQFDATRSTQNLSITAPGRIRPRDGIVTIAAPE
jgi:hypothetical protein